MDEKCSLSLKENIPSDRKIERGVDILKALSDSTRLKIIHLLQDRELCACEIIATLDKPQSTLSHHLNLLKKAGIIKGRKEGTWIYYKLADTKILDDLEDLFKKCEE